MDGGRGFFSATSSTPNEASRDGDGLRNQRLRVDTRLSQKPAAPQDFFASLGVDSTSRGRTGSTSSTRSHSSSTSTTSIMRSKSVAGKESATPTSGWRPPTIGGLGSQRAAPPSPAPSAVSVSGVNRNVVNAATFASSSSIRGEEGSMTTSVTSGSTITLPSGSDGGAKPSAAPTQLFSMDDAEELFSDDGWQCDLPPVVLSDPTDETELGSTVSAAATNADDHVTWSDGDDALASSVAKPVEVRTGLDAVHAGGRTDVTFGSVTDQAAAASTENEFGANSFSSAQVPSSGMKSPYQDARTEVATLPPRAVKSPSSFFMEEPQSTFEITSHSGTQRTSLSGTSQVTSFSETSATYKPYQQDEQWDDEWGNQQKESATAELRPVAAGDFSPPHTTAILTATTGHTDLYVTPPVELTSPGGAAGEFWGDGDEDELFAQDDYVDEDWNEPIEDNPNAHANSASRSSVSHVDSAAPTSPSHDTSYLLLRQPQPPSSGSAFDVRSLPKHSEQHNQMVGRLTESTRALTMPYLFESNSATFVEEKSTVAVQSAESSRFVEPKLSLRTERLQFSSAIAGSTNQDNDLNVFPEAPRSSARFLHTPTGTGGPFGRVPSPHGTDQSFFSEEMSGNVARMAVHDSITFASEEKVEKLNSHTEPSVRMESHSGEHNQLYSEDQPNEDDDRSRRDNYNRQSDEEERDSVVSFSGEKSFFLSTGRPSSTYGGSQSSFASHRMYQSSIASTDHDGSSIASFGVSSAGATFGGSERVSEGGAYSDGAVSESPSMVNSSNASTAFGTDFPSASEGQFSAPGTTIGGSDNASDGGFSDGNVSETTSMCESVHTNSRFVTDFSISGGEYASVGAVEHCSMQGVYASSAPESDSVAPFGEAAPTAAATNFGGDDGPADVDPFTSSPSIFTSSERASNAPLATALGDSRFDHQPEVTVLEENIQSAASLFDATAGADVPNPFGSFGPSSAPAVATPIGEHELPTSDAGDLFGAAVPSSGFQSSFAQPAQNAYGSIQSFDQAYNKADNEARPDTNTNTNTQTSAVDFVQSPFTSVDTHDRDVSVSSVGTQRFVDQNRLDPFASRSLQHGFDNSATSAESVFSSGGDYGHSSNPDRRASLHFGGDLQTPANAAYSRPARNAASVAGHFGQQSNAPSTPHSADQSYSDCTTTYSDQALVGAPNYENQSGLGDGAHTGANTIRTRPYGQSDGDTAGAESATAYGSEGFRQSDYQSLTAHNARQREVSGFGGGSHASRLTSQNGYSQKPAAVTFASAGQPTPSYGSQQIGQSRTTGSPTKYSYRSTAGEVGSGSQTAPSHAGRQHNRCAHNDSDADIGKSADVGELSRPSPHAFFGHLSIGPSSVSDVGDDRAKPLSSGTTQQQPLVQTRVQESFVRGGSNASSHAELQHSRLPVDSTAIQASMHPRDANASYESVGDASLSRHASSSSISHYEGERSFRPEQNLREESASAYASIDANSYAGGVLSGTGIEAASLLFESSVSEDSSKLHIPLSQVSTFNESSMRVVSQFASPHQDLVQQRGRAQPSDREFENVTVVAPKYSHPVPAVEARSRPDVGMTTAMASPVAKDDDKCYQGLERRCDWGSYSVGGNVSSVALASLASQTAPSMSNQFEHMSYGQTSEQQQDRIRYSAASSSHSSYVGAHAFGDNSAGSYFESRAPDDGTAASHTFFQQQQLQEQQYQSHQQQQQQQPQLHHVVTGYTNPGSAVQNELQGASYGAASQHEYENATADGSYQHATRAAPTSAIKTSNEYKDPCVAPPSCLASFGFGGNMVTMFPKRKLRLSVAGSSVYDSPRGALIPSKLDNGGDSKRCIGPVHVYRMNQLHPNNVEFEQMDIFPGPLTEDVSVEEILRYLDDRLKRSEALPTTVKAEDENDRVLLGVLRVLIKCNGKLRSEPGNLNPGAPDTPEAQLITLLSESSKRRNGFNPLTFPEPQEVQSKTNTNVLRELLLAGDRKGAVSSAMTANMWPEAILIASFVDKEMYKRVLRIYLDGHYTAGDPCRALFLTFADQQENSVQEPKPLLQTSVHQPTESLILSNWVSHAQVLLSNRTADTNKILTELGDRLWSEANTVSAAHICYLLASIQLGAPTPSSKMALLGGDHRTPAEARFYVSPGTVQCTEIYEWAQKQSKNASANLMVPFQGYKIIYTMLLADHGKLDTAFKYVTSMLTVIKAMTATMKPGTSVYLEGMKNQLVILDDRLRQHLGQDRVASMAASISRGGGSKQTGKWGLGSALSMMGKIVNRVVEGPESDTASSAVPSTSTSGGVFVNEASLPAASYPNTPSVKAMTSSPTPTCPQQSSQPNRPQGSFGSTVPAGMYGHATPPVSQNSAPGFSNGYQRAHTEPPAVEPSSRSGVAPSAHAVTNGHLAPTSGPFNGNERQQQSASEPIVNTDNHGNSRRFSNKGPKLQKHGVAPRMYSQQSMEFSENTYSTRSSNDFGAADSPCAPLQQQPPFVLKSQQGSHAHPALQNRSALNTSDDIRSSSQPKTHHADLAPVSPTDTTSMSGPASGDKGKAGPMLDVAKKPGRFETPPHSNSGKGSGWLSGLSSFIATKINPEAKIAKLGEQMEAYFDEDAKRWVFPGETAPEEATMPSAPPTGPLLGSAPGSSAAGMPPTGTASAPGSISSGPTPNDPLAALMAPPPPRVLMKKDPLAAMMAPPARPGIYGMHRSASMTQRKTARPQFAVFKPTAPPQTSPADNVSIMS
uniref:Protein transport protein sec16 n=1 Tax=Hyaloperonospora arabidopsidis (strain Emoy2) TaxID=559515 RepID=M4BRG3_HYAAE